MRHIPKGKEPKSFSEWKGMANEDWTPTFENLQNPQKKELHLALLSEQGFTCCYCGREVDAQSSHIEHFRPKSSPTYRNLALAYENLFASCQREVLAETPLVCGNSKADDFDEALFLSPLLPTIEQRFSYTDTGEVLPKDPQAEAMTGALGLNHPFLRSRRGDAIRAVFTAEILTSVTASELADISVRYRLRAENGRMSSFFHAVSRYAEDLIASINAAPPAPPSDAGPVHAQIDGSTFPHTSTEGKLAKFLT
jgi:uncharacterized protein (TIGR02646 family)